jgi:hypothetical protein
MYVLDFEYFFVSNNTHLLKFVLHAYLLLIRSFLGITFDRGLPSCPAKRNLLFDLISFFISPSSYLFFFCLLISFLFLSFNSFPFIQSISSLLLSFYYFLFFFLELFVFCSFNWSPILDFDTVLILFVK